MPKQNTLNIHCFQGIKHVHSFSHINTPPTFNVDTKNDGPWKMYISGFKDGNVGYISMIKIFRGARFTPPKTNIAMEHHLKMYLLSKIMILHCRVSFRGRKIMLCIHATQFLTAQLFLNRQLLISVMDHRQPSVPGAHLHVHRNNCVEIIKFSTFGKYSI